MGRAGSRTGRTSAGILLYRRREGGLEVLVGHPGGPLWAARDEGHWTIPKGEAEPDEELVAVARREFAEETGHEAPDGSLIPLGEIRQKSGKRVHAWGVEGDLDPSAARSNMFPLEWPPRSGRTIDVPELDRVVWATPDEARRLLKEAQRPLVDRLEAALRDPRT